MIHLLVRTDDTPLQFRDGLRSTAREIVDAPTKYFALCGHMSEDKRAFRVDLERVTCEKCRNIAISGQRSARVVRCDGGMEG